MQIIQNDELCLNDCSINLLFKSVLLFGTIFIMVFGLALHEFDDHNELLIN